MTIVGNIYFQLLAVVDYLFSSEYLIRNLMQQTRKKGAAISKQAAKVTKSVHDVRKQKVSTKSTVTAKIPQTTKHSAKTRETGSKKLVGGKLQAKGSLKVSAKLKSSPKAIVTKATSTKSKIASKSKVSKKVSKSKHGLKSKSKHGKTGSKSKLAKKRKAESVKMRKDKSAKPLSHQISKKKITGRIDDTKIPMKPPASSKQAKNFANKQTIGKKIKPVATNKGSKSSGGKLPSKPGVKRSKVEITISPAKQKVVTKLRSASSTISKSPVGLKVKVPVGKQRDAKSLVDKSKPRTSSSENKLKLTPHASAKSRYTQKESVSPTKVDTCSRKRGSCSKNTKQRRNKLEVGLKKTRGDSQKKMSTVSRREKQPEKPPKKLSPRTLENSQNTKISSGKKTTPSAKKTVASPRKKNVAGLQKETAQNKMAASAKNKMAADLKKKKDGSSRTERAAESRKKPVKGSKKKVQRSGSSSSRQESIIGAVFRWLRRLVLGSGTGALHGRPSTITVKCA